ncbi:terminase small subunit [Halocella sp. SP3-1]|uniref:terminase small subunit n=1 Tax=Halocella sp. SP3-1 TaxID=2382161 RepID=UPI000F760420|nr:terminase small subunit [Halocella sp. SP3-1]AZO96145.1 terminase small subunit [Halocella sp. SP3-1]
MAGLTEKQKAFADEYIISLNATEAAIKAGYSENTAGAIGHENLKKPKIANYIQKQLDSKENKRIASQDEVLEFLTTTMRSQEDSRRDRLEAAKLLGKRYAIFTDRIEHEVTELPTINLVRGDSDGN